MIHAGLKKEFKLGLNLDAFNKNKHVLFFMSVPNETAVSPKTFCWFPWTPFLFH